MKLIPCSDEPGNKLRLYWQCKMKCPISTQRSLCVCYMCVVQVPEHAHKSTWVQQGKWMYSIQHRLDTKLFTCIYANILFVFISFISFAAYILEEQLKNVLCVTIPQYASIKRKREIANYVIKEPQAIWPVKHAVVSLATLKRATELV